jgi:hypothetical protein
VKKTKIYEGVVVPLSKVNLFRDDKGRLCVLHCNCLSTKHWNKFNYKEENHTFPVTGAVCEYTCPKCNMFPWYFTGKQHRDQFHNRFTPIWAGTPEWKEALK